MTILLVITPIQIPFNPPSGFLMTIIHTVLMGAVVLGWINIITSWLLNSDNALAIRFDSFLNVFLKVMFLNMLVTTWDIPPFPYKEALAVLICLSVICVNFIVVGSGGGSGRCGFCLAAKNS